MTLMVLKKGFSVNLVAGIISLFLNNFSIKSQKIHMINRISLYNHNYKRL